MDGSGDDHTVPSASVLIKQTPDEFWSSPVIKVVNDSINST